MAPKVRQSNTQNRGQGNTNQRVIKVPASIGRSTGPMDIIGRVRNRSTGTIAGDDIAGDNLERNPYVPRGYKMTEEKIEVAGFVNTREWQIKETKLYALASGLKENYKATAKKLAKSLSIKFYDLMQKYTGIRPLDAVRREVGDVKLRVPKRRKRNSF